MMRVQHLFGTVLALAFLAPLVSSSFSSENKGGLGGHRWYNQHVRASLGASSVDLVNKNVNAHDDNRSMNKRRNQIVHRSQKRLRRLALQLNEGDETESEDDEESTTETTTTTTTTATITTKETKPGDFWNEVFQQEGDLPTAEDVTQLIGDDGNNVSVSAEEVVVSTSTSSTTTDMTQMGIYDCPDVPFATGFLYWSDLVKAINDESAGGLNTIFLLCPTVFVANEPLVINDSRIEIGCVTVTGCIVQNATLTIADGVTDVVLAGLHFEDQAGEITIGWDTRVRLIACSFRQTVFPGSGVQRAAVVTAGDALFLGCRFHDNIGQGGAVFVAGGAPFFESCHFVGNQATTDDPNAVTAAALLVCADNNNTAEVSIRRSCFDENVGGDSVVYVYNVPNSQVILNDFNAISTSSNQGSGAAVCTGVATFYNESLTACDEFEHQDTTCAVLLAPPTPAPAPAAMTGHSTTSPTSSPAPTIAHSTSPTSSPVPTIAHSTSPTSSPVPTIAETYSIDTVVEPTFEPGFQSDTVIVDLPPEGDESLPPPVVVENETLDSGGAEQQTTGGTHPNDPMRSNWDDPRKDPQPNAVSQVDPLAEALANYRIQNAAVLDVSGALVMGCYWQKAWVIAAVVAALFASSTTLL